MAARAPRPTSEVVSLTAIVVAGAFFFALVVARVDGINGPDYWRWVWRSIPWTASGALALYGPPLACFVGAQLCARRPPLALALLMASAACSIAAAQAILSDAGALDRAAQVIESTGAHGYFRDAMRLDSDPEWLSHYGDWMRRMHLHGKTKGPGIMLWYRALFALAGRGPEVPRIVAMLLAALSVLGVPAMYALTRTLGGRRQAALAAASLFALAPSLGAFWPSFDAVYPAMTCAQVITWHRALVTDRARWSIAFGVLCAVAWLFAYNLLVLGAFLFVHALVWSTSRRRALGPSLLRAWQRPGKHALITAAAIALTHVVLHVATGFDPIATLRAALAIQADLLLGIARPYPDTVLFDLTDLALGLAWVPVIPALVGTASAFAERRRRVAALCAVCLFEPILIAVLALLPGETARVMIFLMPFVLVPAALEVGRWHPASRATLYAITFVLSIVISRSMVFVAI